MGVIHKLNPDVLNFILEQKKANPAIGCRKLAELVSARFQITVSKSSVNNVLKDANLSNSVGRPNKKTREKLKKFQIPSEKKQQISEALKSIPIPDNVQTKDSAQDVPPDLGDTPSQISRHQSGTADQTADQNEWGEAVTMNNAGGMLLLAAFYETMDETLLGSLLSDYSDQSDRKEFERRCNAALLMSSLDIKEPREREILLKQQADFDFDPDDLRNFLERETTDVDRILLETKIDLELSQLENNAGGFSLSLESGEVVSLSPYFTVTGKATGGSRPVPLKLAVAKLSEEILVNHQPLLFMLDEDADPADALKIIAAFECIKGHKINNISILGHNGQAQLDFAYITNKRRNYVYGIYPGQSDFARFAKAPQWPARSEYKDVLGRSWEYCVTRSDYAVSHIPGMVKEPSVVTVWSEGKKEPELALVSNMGSDHKILLQRHLDYFIALGCESAKRPDPTPEDAPRDAEFTGGELVRLRNVFDKFGEFLLRHVEREYLGGGNNGIMAQDLLGLNGVLVPGKAVVEVSFSPENVNPELVNKMKEIAENVNIRKIYDSQHRVLRFYVK